MTLLDIFLCVFGVAFSIYLGLKGYGSPRNIDFIVGAFISGSFCLSQIIPSFVGGLVGGVVGVLLPKLSSGLELGVFLSIVVSIGLFGERAIMSTFDEISFSSISFLICITLSIILTQRHEAFFSSLRTAFASSFAFTLGIDQIFTHGLSSAVAEVLRMNPDDKHNCYGECLVPLMLGIWLAVATIIFVTFEIVSGSYKNWFKSGTRQYLAVKTQADTKAIAQRTFSYPDTLEFNYFDPDNVPDLVRPHADIIFITVQKLASAFGFQVDNSRNQAEHLLMMLANETRFAEVNLAGPANRLHIRMFSNYQKWCDRIGAPPEFVVGLNGRTHAAAIEDMLLFLLIWGEAANLRHLPECLCWLYHQTMKEHLSQSNRVRENLYPGFYLDMVITPIYDVVAASLRAKGDHVAKKIYDDFNEFFWSPSCLRYAHRENLSAEQVESGTGRRAFPDQQSQSMSMSSTSLSSESMSICKALQSASKTYLERRSWLHPLLSFHRIIEWHVVSFYLIATVAFAHQLVWSTAFTTQVGSFVFWLITLMSIIWTCLEVWVVYPSTALSGPALFGFLLRLIFGYIVLAYQSIYYHWSFRTDIPDPDSLRANGDAIFWWSQFVWLSLAAHFLYLVESLLCWVPSIVSGLLCWNNDLVQSMLNILYPFSQLYVGKRLSVPQSEVMFYILFWLTLLAFKFWFGYYYIIAPVTVPTLQLYDDFMNFLHVPFIKTAFLMAVWWFPHFLVYLIDLSIWYTVWAAGVGGFIALVDRQGAVRDGDSLRSHFMRMPYAFCQKLMPSNTLVGNPDLVARKASAVSITRLPDMPAAKAQDNPKKQPKGVGVRPKSSADLGAMNMFSALGGAGGGNPSERPESSKRASLEQIINVRTQRWLAFSRAWNSILKRLRDTDHLSDAEYGILSFTSFEWLSKPVYLPLFQTAGCCESTMYSFKSAAEAYHKEIDPLKKIAINDRFRASMDVTSAEAVNEAWELACWIISRMVGNVHAQDMSLLFSVIGKWSTSEDILNRVSMDNLPTIYDHVSSLVTALKNGLGKRKKSPVVTPESLVTVKAADNDRNKAFTTSTTQNQKNVSENSAAPKLMKKSVSTSFLTGLGDSAGDSGVAEKSITSGPVEKGTNSATSKPSTSGKAFAKLQPFRKTAVLTDSLRDKVREELRGLLNCIRTSLRARTGGVSAEAQDLIDRVTFVLSMESGFLWNDIYASTQLDELAKDSWVPGAVSKLHGLQNVRQTQVEPASPEARRRLHFFANSLFMDMPVAPSMKFAKDYSCVTPYYSEDVLLTRADLEAKNSDGVSTMLYLQTLYKKDWLNFLERRQLSDDQHIWSAKHAQETRMWASLRAQTLFRTVEGIMYTEAAIRLLAELEQISAPDVEVLSKLKFSYVVACQVYGQMKKNIEHKADDIEFLLSRHPNLRIAYIDSIRVNREGDMSYYSVLIKGEYVTPANEVVSTSNSANKTFRVKEVYRVKLPGNPVLGEGKPENQNHALIFTRGRYLQAIDMNQDGYFEEALKMRNLLEEFNSGCAILGFREHIFTGSVSSVANYMALQELSFVTLGQRVLSNPLRVRQHYGHPDLFNKLFVMTEGGMSKASRGINLSEDVFAGFNATIRGHTVNFKEYAQVGKGRDVGLQQTYKFEAKLSQGNAEQSLSRDMSRINDRLDFFRLMSFYYGGIGHYIANTMVIFTLVVVIYCMLGQAIYEEETVNGRPVTPEGLLQLALAGLGILQTFPLLVTLTVEKGVFRAMSEIGFMILSGGPIYFIFHIQTKCYYFAQTLLAGGAMYRPTGRGFVIRHSPFDENYRFFAFSHIYLGFEIMAALVIMVFYTTTKQYAGLTWALWLAGVSFVFAPFWFNPLSFEWNRISEDYLMWMRWMMEKGGTAEQSWEIWWREETAFIHRLSWSWKLVMFLTRSCVWTFVTVGMAGEGILTKALEKERVTQIICLYGAFVVGHWVTSKLERSCSYALRRLSSFLVSATVAGFAIYLYLRSRQYITLTIALYYLASAVSLVLLLFGFKPIAYVYKIHDFIVGHFIFFVLLVLCCLQVGVLQTWLLYHNALSAGVVIEDILRHARKTKERAVEDGEVSLAELRAQLAEQEKTIRMLMEDRERDRRAGAVEKTSIPELEISKKSSLVQSSGTNVKSYGSTESPTTSAALKPALSSAAAKPQSTLPTSTLKSAVPSSRSDGEDFSSQSGSSAKTASSGGSNAALSAGGSNTALSGYGSSAAPVAFVFSQPAKFPVREPSTESLK